MLAEQTDSITLTPTAIQAVRELIAKRELEGFALRVFVSGGGCSGLQYGMSLEENVRDQDLTFEFDEVKVVVDEVSITYMQGATIDFIEDVMGSGFKIDNPNAIAACGCGTSFNTKDNPGNQDTSCSTCY